MAAASRSLARRCGGLVSTHGRDGIVASRLVARRMGTGSFPAIFARGGTAKGLVVLRDHLPPPDQWGHILPSALGSPDPYRRQLDGMGSGISSPASASKVCILAPSSRPHADVEATFLQVGVRNGEIHQPGICRNIMSIVGPVALDQGLLGRLPEVETDAAGVQTTVVRILDAKSGEVILSRFRVAGDRPRYCPEGDFELSGVPGTQSRIVLSFNNPAGVKSGKALPTGNLTDTLVLPDGDTIEASLLDVSTPCIFVRASDLGVEDFESVSFSRIQSDESLDARLDAIREAGASLMVFDPKVMAFPRLIVVFPRPPPDSAAHVICKALGKHHAAFPMSEAMCVGAAVRMPGTIPHKLSRPPGEGEGIMIAHPGGRIDVGATVEAGEVLSVELHRTARVLMIGEVFYRS